MNRYADLSRKVELLASRDPKPKPPFESALKSWEKSQVSGLRKVWTRFCDDCNVSSSRHALFEEKPVELELLQIFFEWRSQSGAGRITSKISLDTQIKEWRAIARYQRKAFGGYQYSYAEFREMEKASCHM
jgi:hypothetical protein